MACVRPSWLCFSAKACGPSLFPSVTPVCGLIPGTTRMVEMSELRSQASPKKTFRTQARPRALWRCSSWGLRQRRLHPPWPPLPLGRAATLPAVSSCGVRKPRQRPANGKAWCFCSESTKVLWGPSHPCLQRW